MPLFWNSASSSSSSFSSSSFFFGKNIQQEHHSQALHFIVMVYWRSAREERLQMEHFKRSFRLPWTKHLIHKKKRNLVSYFFHNASRSNCPCTNSGIALVQGLGNGHHFGMGWSRSPEDSQNTIALSKKKKKKEERKKTYHRLDWLTALVWSLELELTVDLVFSTLVEKEEGWLYRPACIHMFKWKP